MTGVEKWDIHIMPEPMSGCWVWIGPRHTAGYGQVWHEGKRTTAHRAIYEALVGPVPNGLELDHLCRNRACVNPAHLEPVTHQENMRRGNRWVGWIAPPDFPCGHPRTEDNTYSHLHRGILRSWCKLCRRMNLRLWRARA